jgi:bromodomain-containing protein 9
MTQLFLKKARSIQELARKKFERLRSEFERSEKELKSEQKTRSNSLIKKPVKKPFCRTSQEPVGSDFSTGATLATIGDVQNGSNLNQGGGCERPSNTDSVVEGNPSLIDTNLEKAEELSSGIMKKVFPFYHYVQHDDRCM